MLYAIEIECLFTFRSNVINGFLIFFTSFEYLFYRSMPIINILTLQCWDQFFMPDLDVNLHSAGIDFSRQNQILK